MWSKARCFVECSFFWDRAEHNEARLDTNLAGQELARLAGMSSTVFTTARSEASPAHRPYSILAQKIPGSPVWWPPGIESFLRCALDFLRKRFQISAPDCSTQKEIAEAAEERNSAVAVLIDEIQYFNQKELGTGAHRTGDIANTLGVKVSNLGPVRARLIKKGMVYSPAHGDMAFTVPLFDEFMVRAMPRFAP